MKIKTYSLKGTKLAEASLPKNLEAKENPRLLGQAVHVYRDRAHVGLAKTKTRAEVIRTKKKVYRQKGTGGARHGARSAPIYVGGGVAHGPRPIARQLGLATKLKKLALRVALSEAVGEGKIVFLSGLGAAKKTGDLKKFLQVLGNDGKRTLFVLAEGNRSARRVLRNVKRAEVVEWKDLNAYEIFLASKIVIDKEVFGKETKKA